MARLREPDEAKTRRSVKEPSSYQVRQSQGLPNTKFDRDKLKFDKEKVALAQKNKEADREQKERHHQEKLSLTGEKADAAHRSREDVAHDKWAADARKQQQVDNVAAFKNFLFEKYGDVIDEKGTRGIPLEIEKRAARYAQMAKTDGAGAIEKFKGDFAQEEQTKKQYQALRPEILKTAEAQKGSALSPEEVAALDKAPHERMAAAVSSFQEKQVATQARDQAVRAKAGEDYAAISPTPEVAGNKPRYRADEFGGPGVGGNLPVRSDLNYGEASEAYNDVVDRAVADKGGGFLPTAAGAWMKYMPGARDLVDPNTPLRAGVRKAGEAIAGAFKKPEEQMGPPAPAQPGVPTAEPKATGPTFAERAINNPFLTAGQVALPVGQAALKGIDTGFDVAGKKLVQGGEAIASGVSKFAQGIGKAAGEVEAPASNWATMGTNLEGQPPPALAAPTTPSLDLAPVPGPAPVGAVPGPAAPEAVPPPTEPGAIAPMAKPGNIFSGLAETVKGIFTSSPENTENIQNVWRSLPQTQEPVTPSSPAIKRPEDEQNMSFPKAM
jgi:hypothetical protein